MTTQLTKYTKAELLAHIEELEADHRYAIEAKDDEIKDLNAQLAENESVLRTRINSFATAIEKPFPALHRNLKSALDNQLFWVDEPPTGYVSAPIPPSATHVRWMFEDGRLEFQYQGVGARYWTAPLDGAYCEVA